MNLWNPITLQTRVTFENNSLRYEINSLSFVYNSLSLLILRDLSYKFIKYNQLLEGRARWYARMAHIFRKWRISVWLCNFLITSSKKYHPLFANFVNRLLLQFGYQTRFFDDDLLYFAKRSEMRNKPVEQQKQRAKRFELLRFAKWALWWTTALSDMFVYVRRHFS